MLDDNFKVVTPMPYTAFIRCSDCGALLLPQDGQLHVDWHNEMIKFIKDMSSVTSGLRLLS